MRYTKDNGTLEEYSKLEDEGHWLLDAIARGNPKNAF